MRRLIIVAVIIAVLISMVATVQAAPPPDGPPGLKRAIEAQEAHTNALLNIPGVVGTAVSLGADGQPVVKIYTESAGVAGLPKKLDGVPVSVEVTGKIIALVKPPPVASFTTTCSDLTVTFDASASSGTKLTYEWDFGDDSTPAYGMIVSHEYKAGTYQVTLTVTDKFEVPGTSTQWVTVPCVPGNTPPVASFTYITNELTCEFDGSGSYDPDGSIAGYAWDFGDGGSGSGVTVSHGYAEAGTYSVTLTVTDNDGATGTDAQEVTVGSQESRYHRPAYIGTSSGRDDLILNPDDGKWYCTVGTLGVRLTDGTNVYALSNNHVYALENNGDVGDNILQPGRVDMTDQACGSEAEIAEAVIGQLHSWVDITFSTTENTNNKVDAAIALTTTDMVGQSTPQETGYGIPSSTPVGAQLGMRVQKHGRTTGLTTGRITGINAIIQVGYDAGTARFVNQIAVFGPRFSSGGDSGSLIVTTNGLNPVALLFAGGGSYTFGNPIGEVLYQLSEQPGIGNLTIDGT